MSRNERTGKAKEKKRTGIFVFCWFKLHETIPFCFFLPVILLVVHVLMWLMTGIEKEMTIKPGLMADSQAETEY